MSADFLRLAVTPAVARAQAQYYGRSMPVEAEANVTPAAVELGEDERAFIAARDSFYLSTVTEHGWPYIQHRGGAPGFLRVVGPSTLAFADYSGNRQMLSTGNLAANARVALFLMDYPRRTRLKLLGHAEVVDARGHAELIAQLADPAARRVVERVITIEVVAFDWNCPKYITPRYTAEEIAEATVPLRNRIAELEARVKELSR